MTLSSSSVSNAQVPTSVTVAPGQTQATFTATTGPTCSQSSVVITAAYGGVSQQNALFFNTAPSTDPLTLSATGRSGESISSSPAGLTVPVGTTGSASFAMGTVVTLTVSNGRDAIWSGGCSSHGDTQKSCSLTLNAATSVTANVQ